ncbi:MAG: hypothetical protein QW035_04115 [Candidatus Anstonellales archaeon]
MNKLAFLIPFLLLFACVSFPEENGNDTIVAPNATIINNTTVETPSTYIAVIGDTELFNTVDYSLPKGYKAIAVECTDESLSYYSYFIIDEPSAECIHLISISNPFNLYINIGSYSSSNVFALTPDEGQYAKALAELIGSKRMAILYEESQTEFKETLKNHYKGQVLLEEKFFFVPDNQLLKIRQLYPEALLVLSRDENVAAGALEKAFSMIVAKNVYGGKYEISTATSNLMPLWNGFKGVSQKKTITQEGEQYISSFVNKYGTPSNREKVLLGADASALIVDAIESGVPPVTYLSTLIAWNGYTGIIKFNHVHQRVGDYVAVEVSNGQLKEVQPAQ